MTTRKKVKAHKKKTRKRQFLYNPENPKLSFDVYIDKDPSDTISIKYSTVKDVKRTIKKLERLYKSNKYTHKRIWQVRIIMKVRLESMYKRRKTMKKAKNIGKRYFLSRRYFKFLSRRSRVNGNTKRKRMTFKLPESSS